MNKICTYNAIGAGSSESSLTKPTYLNQGGTPVRSDVVYTTAHRMLAGRRRQILMSTLIIAATVAIAAAQSVPTTDSRAVVAEVGAHQITQQQVDAKLRLQLYNARKAVIDQMVD